MAEVPALGLYLHWPFCQAKCPYCDFNSHVVADVDQDRWSDAFVREITRAARETEGRVLNSIFIGGGTPSLMYPETVQRVISAAQMSWTFSNDIEITLEANPTSVEASAFHGFHAAGVNRVSIGVQSLRDDGLRELGRLHTADEAKAAVDLALDVFPRVSFDLIYARQNQSLDGWVSELREALSIGVSHLSLYQLTIEEGTAFGERHSRGKLAGLPHEDAAADMYEVTQELTTDAGLPAYEVSNHAVPGEEARHNLIYWRSQDWLGLGPGAHGRLTRDGRRLATEAHRSPSLWIASVERNGSGNLESHILPETEVVEEAFIMGLRLREGLPETRVPQELVLRIEDMVDLKLLERQEGALRTTSRGRPVLDFILRSILT